MRCTWNYVNYILTNDKICDTFKSTLFPMIMRMDGQSRQFKCPTENKMAPERCVRVFNSTKVTKLIDCCENNYEQQGKMSLILTNSIRISLKIHVLVDVQLGCC